MIKNKTNALIYTLVGIVVICAIAYTYVAQKGKIGMVPQNQPQMNASSLTNQQIVAALPNNFPIPNGSLVTASATIPVNPGKFNPNQYNLFFNSNNSIQDNLALYKNYCLSNKLDILKEIQANTGDLLVCQNNVTAITISLNPFTLSVGPSSAGARITTSPSTASSSVVLQLIKSN